MKKRIYRSEKNKMIAGVCGGIAEYFDIDVSLVRLGCIAFCAVGGCGIAAYVAAIIIIPKESDIHYGE